MATGKYVNFGRLVAFTRSIWFNKLLRQVYKSLPLPWHVKQRLKEIYLRRPGAWKIRHKDTFQLAANREALPQVAASAKQFDPADPWVLVVDSLPTDSDQDSGSVRMLTILRVLREMGLRITFISDSENYLPHYQEDLEKDDIDVLYGFDAARSHLAATGGKYHFVLLSRPEFAFRYLSYIRAYALYSQVIYDTADLHWVRFEREMRVSGDNTLLDVIIQFRRIELYNTACADLVLAITDEEKNRLLIEQPDAKVTVLPNIHEIIPPKTPFAQRRGLLFIGGFWHKPNEDAVTFFVQNILPQITEKIPDLVFYIIGSNIPPSIESLRSTNVEPLGAVPDITPYFESCRIFVAPLRFGTGMKGKVGHSLSHGLPTVATRIGAEGMDLRHEKHLLIADDPEDFADMVIRLYNDEALWRRLSAESLMHLTTNYSLAAARERMIRIFAKRQDEASRGGCQEDNTAIPACSANVSL
ncbi:Glycosyltransferase involved in cell wall bisynthesis [Nitrosospira sp. Nsp18]|uniref:glycosyltransferase n=1 Tax=Nitrosospira sp. Nsp18 TaxID=1855334 RepID=UPI000884E8A2|nr:glycosyltransferase [Nitrosospira sp. Nsp18]SDA21942.1 Glycosyltransferase involved in cell wall bisynthesis [Nitrosospira sp. Nsp18]